MALFSSHVGKTCRKKTETLLNAMNPSILLRLPHVYGAILMYYKNI